MLGALIGLILVCIVLGFLWWAFQQLIGLVPIAEPFLTIIRILFAAIVLVVILWAIMTILGDVGVSVQMPRLK
jgi:uncharacterized metal-binding protein